MTGEGTPANPGRNYLFFSFCFCFSCANWVSSFGKASSEVPCSAGLKRDVCACVGLEAWLVQRGNSD